MNTTVSVFEALPFFISFISFVADENVIYFADLSPCDSTSQLYCPANPIVNRCVNMTSFCQGLSNCTNSKLGKDACGAKLFSHRYLLLHLKTFVTFPFSNYQYVYAHLVLSAFC
jgi:hypothetical protein